MHPDMSQVERGGSYMHPDMSPVDLGVPCTAGETYCRLKPDTTVPGTTHVLTGAGGDLVP